MGPTWGPCIWETVMQLGLLWGPRQWDQDLQIHGLSLWNLFPVVEYLLQSWCREEELGLVSASCVLLC